jgi:signal transduction histidine kinase
MIAWSPTVGRLLAAITFVVSFAFSYGPGSLKMSLPVAAIVALLAAATVLLSGSQPVAGLVVAAVLTGLLPLIDSTFDAMALVIVLVGFQAAARSPLPPWMLVASVFGMLAVNEVWTRVAFDRSFAEPSVVNPVLMTALGVGLGLQSRKVMDQNRELARLHVEAERAAVLEERRRIARDVHDIAAHHLSALVVRNQLARRVGSPDALEAAAAFTSDTAAETLNSLRRVVGVLSANDDAPHEPQPTLDELDRVVDRMRSAGLAVERRTGLTATASLEVQMTIVRIVQEALANVLRHRGPGRAWVELDQDGDHVVLTVDDDGLDSNMQPGADDERRTAVVARAGDDPMAGRGLIGMKERAQACGGSLDVGRSSRGGWRVSARLPVTAR